MDESRPSIIAQTILDYRRQAMLTQEELAALAGLSARSVSNIERGHTQRPYWRSLRLLADALKIPEEVRRQLAYAREAVR